MNRREWTELGALVSFNGMLGGLTYHAGGVALWAFSFVWAVLSARALADVHSRRAAQ